MVSGFIQASAALAAQAQQVAGRGRNRNHAVQEESSSRGESAVRYVDGVELYDAVHAVPDNGSEQSRQEHQRQQRDGRPPSTQKVDLTA